MKFPILTTIVGVSLAAVPAFAEAPKQQAPASAPSVVSAESVLRQLDSDIKASPQQAGQILKAAITASGADTVLVLQMVKTALTAAPEQAEDIMKFATVAAPESMEQIAVLAEAVKNGDEVAQVTKKTIKLKASQSPVGYNLPLKVFFSNEDAVTVMKLLEKDSSAAWIKYIYNKPIFTTTQPHTLKSPVLWSITSTTITMTTPTTNTLP